MATLDKAAWEGFSEVVPGELPKDLENKNSRQKQSLYKDNK